MSMMEIAAKDVMEMAQIRAITRQERPLVASEDLAGQGKFC
jgi:hypothetical protein